MAKKHLFLLFLYLIGLGTGSASSTNQPLTISSNLEECNAPAPDSFQVEVVGSGSIQLTWQPAWPSANHTITAFKENSQSNAWDTIAYLNHVSGATYTFTGLQRGWYKFAIATECSSNDEPSGIIATSPPVGLILDLILNGRVPINPTPTPQCTEIPYESYNWVGFKIESASGLGSAGNYFEFGVGDENQAVIKRVGYGPQIVATAPNFPYIYPQNPPALNIVELDNIVFMVRRVDGSNPLNIGKLIVTHNPFSSPKTLKICKVENFPWSDSYSFNMATATSANGFGNKLVADRNEALQIKNGVVCIANPVHDLLNISLNGFLTQKDIFIQIFDMKGSLVFEKSDTILFSNYLIDLEAVANGIYFIKIVIDDETLLKKVIKI